MAQSIGVVASRYRGLAVRKDSFKRIMSAYGFPKVFAETIRFNNGSFGSFLDYEKVNDKVSPSFLCGFLFHGSSHLIACN